MVRVLASKVIEGNDALPVPQLLQALTIRPEQGNSALSQELWVEPLKKKKREKRINSATQTCFDASQVTGYYFTALISPGKFILFPSLGSFCISYSREVEGKGASPSCKELTWKIQPDLDKHRTY